MEPKNLKLIAKTEEDLRIVSAHLQDSIASVSDIANLKKNKIFLSWIDRKSFLIHFSSVKINIYFRAIIANFD